MTRYETAEFSGNYDDGTYEDVPGISFSVEGNSVYRLEVFANGGDAPPTGSDWVTLRPKGTESINPVFLEGGNGIYHSTDIREGEEIRGPIASAPVYFRAVYVVSVSDDGVLSLEVGSNFAFAYFVAIHAMLTKLETS